MPKLTKRVVDAAEPRASDFFIWCSEMPGFGVRVFANGKRSYLVQYRKDGRTRRVTLGAHGKITTEDARKLAQGVFGDIAKGGDPAEERATRRASMTVSELCDSYLHAAARGHIAGKRGQPKKATTLATDKGRIERHIKPLLGRKLARDLTPADCTRWVRDVSDGKTATIEKTDVKRGKAIVEGGPGTAARTAGLLGGILTFAVGEGIIPSNPMRGVKRPAGTAREKRLSPSEYGRLGAALDAVAAEGKSWQGVAAIRLLAMTGCRLSEIIELTWAEVDAAGSALRMGDTKEGRSARSLGKPALAILASLPRTAGQSYVFPAVRQEGEAYGGYARVWDKVKAKAGFEGVSAHTLRHSFGSIAGDLGYSDSTIAALLGHAAGTVTRRYIHHLDKVLISAADNVCECIADQMSGDKKNDTI